MKTERIISIVGITVTVLILGYSLFQIRPTSAEVQTKIDSLVPAGEVKPVDTNILNNQAFTKIDSLKTFGKRPVGADAGSLNRSNPFEGN